MARERTTQGGPGRAGTTAGPCPASHLSGGRLDSAAALAPKRPLTRGRAVRPADLRRAGVRSEGGRVRLHARLRARASRNLRFKSSCPSSGAGAGSSMSASSEPSCGEGSAVMVTSGFGQWEAQLVMEHGVRDQAPQSGRASAKVGEAYTPPAAGHNGSRSPTNTTRRASSSPHDRRQRSHWPSDVLRTGGQQAPRGMLPALTDAGERWPMRARLLPDDGLCLCRGSSRPLSPSSEHRSMTALSLAQRLADHRTPSRRGRTLWSGSMPPRSTRSRSRRSCG